MARNDGLRDYQQEMKLRLFEEWELHRSVVKAPPSWGGTHCWWWGGGNGFLCGGVGCGVWVGGRAGEGGGGIERGNVT